MSELKALQDELALRQDDLNTCIEMLGLDATDADALESKPILEADIASINSKIAALKSQANSAPPPPGTDVPPPPPGFRKVSHDEAPPPPSEEAHVTFNVKDAVMAKFSEDKQWYAATITSKTGSAADPVYKVTFKGYGNVETKRKHEIRAVENPKKRKADAPPPPPTSDVPAPPVTANSNGNTRGAVISAAPAIENKPLPKREPSKVSDGPTRLPPEPKKLKGSKALDKQKNSWQSWQQSGPKKSAASGAAMKKMGKDSQFRTPDLPGAKVGFTGSGRPMQKDQARSKWNFKGGESED